jgi:hypothetical protein
VRLEIVAFSADEVSRWSGAVLCRDVPGPEGGPALPKGHRLTSADAWQLSRAAPTELHLLWLDDDDVHEDVAATLLAQAVAGPGVETHPPVESQVRLSAGHRGLVQVDAATLAALNTLDGVTIFTVPDGTPVDSGATLAGVKITPLALPRRILGEAEGLARAAASVRVLCVRPFLPLRVRAVVRQPLSQAARGRFEALLRSRVSWLGGSLGSVDYPDDRTTARAALLGAVADADLVLLMGVASVDPLESTWSDLIEAGASVIRRGLPVHPGSTYWLVTLDGTPIIGVASCGVLARRSALDLLLIRHFAGGALDRDFLAGLGHGGLLVAGQRWRIPAYDGGLENDER